MSQNWVRIDYGEGKRNMTSIDFAAARGYHQKREAHRRAQREAERQRWLKRVREVVPRLAIAYPEVRRVYLFGSLAQSGRFRPDSDIDLAVECETLEAESAFWRALEQELGRDVDMRPLTGVIAEIVANQGEQVYGR
jgi:predicted nucleotidyltransferase